MRVNVDLEHLQPPADDASPHDVLAFVAAAGELLDGNHELPSAMRDWMRAVDARVLLAALASAGRVDLAHMRSALTRIALTQRWPQAVREELLGSLERTDDTDMGSPPSGASDASSLELDERLIREEEPSDEVVAAYVQRGALARYVEGVAERNPSFAEQLVAIVDAFESGGETVSNVALRARSRLVGRDDRLAEVAAAVEIPAAVTPLRFAKRARVLGAVALAATLLLGIGFGAYQMQESESASASAVRARDAARARELQRLLDELKAQEQSIASAQEELREAQNEVERAKAIQQLEAAQEKARASQAAIASARGARPQPHTPKAACTCQAGDPLCSCL